MTSWGKHVYRTGNEEQYDIENPEESISLQKKHIEPWLAAVFQSEHLSLLLGSGFTTAVASQSGTSAADMSCDYSGFPLSDELASAADKAARAMGRGEANIEDQIRAETVLSQCNSFLLHRITNDRDQELIARLVPDNARGLLRELPSLPTRHCILLGIASMIPALVEVKHLRDEQKPESDDPDFWKVWTNEKDRPIDWEKIANEWIGGTTDNDALEDTGESS